MSAADARASVRAVGSPPIADSGDVPAVEPNPSGGKDQSKDESGGKGLPDKPSEIPEGDGTVDPVTDWSDVADLQVDVRATDEVTVLGEDDETPAVTEAPDGSVVAPPVEVEVSRTGEDSSPGLVLAITPTGEAAEGPTAESSQEPTQDV